MEDKSIFYFLPKHDVILSRWSHLPSTRQTIKLGNRFVTNTEYPFAHDGWHKRPPNHTSQAKAPLNGASGSGHVSKTDDKEAEVTFYVFLYFSNVKRLYSNLSCQLKWIKVNCRT